MFRAVPFSVNLAKEYAPLARNFTWVLENGAVPMDCRAVTASTLQDFRKVQLLLNTASCEWTPDHWSSIFTILRANIRSLGSGHEVEVRLNVGKLGMHLFSEPRMQNSVDNFAGYSFSNPQASKSECCYGRNHDKYERARRIVRNLLQIPSSELEAYCLTGCLIDLGEEARRIDGDMYVESWARDIKMTITADNVVDLVRQVEAFNQVGDDDLWIVMEGNWKPKTGKQPFHTVKAN